MGNTQRTTLGPIPDTQIIVNNGKFVYEIYHALAIPESNPEPLRCSEIRPAKA